MPKEPFVVSDSDRRILESRVREQTLPRRDWQRATIVLLAAKGVANRDISATVDLNVNDVAKWQSRYRKDGLKGLADLPRSGRPATYGPKDRLKLVRCVTEDPPEAKSRWTTLDVAERFADEIGISRSQVWRIFDSLDLKPWRVRSWMTSHDPDFWAKAADICDLYLNMASDQRVVSVDEKTGMQALGRKNPTKPALPGRPVLEEFEYVRNGTRVLLAGLDVATGETMHWLTDSTRSDNFVHFLARLDAETPAHQELHLVVDNLSAHGTPAVEEWLDTHHRVFIHRTPTHASWLNQVELVFSILGRGLLNHGDFDGTDQLSMAVGDFLDHRNNKAEPFNWRYDASAQDQAA